MEKYPTKNTLMDGLNLIRELDPKSYQQHIDKHLLICSSLEELPITIKTKLLSLGWRILTDQEKENTYSQYKDVNLLLIYPLQRIKKGRYKPFS